MELSKGEKKALVFLLIMILGFMPPVINLANRITPYVLGMPFLLFWVSFMVLMTSVLMTCAYIVRERTDRP